jgi:PAS domain S-box-containing protein
LERLAAVEAELARARASEAEMRAILSAMMDVVLVIDATGRYVKIPSTATNKLYKPGDELLGRTLHEMLPIEVADFFLSSIQASLRSQGLVTIEYGLIIDGREVPFSATISPMSDSLVVIVARDVTDSKRAAQEATDNARRQGVIEAQKAALAELSTPLIPITEEIVVMPLIGVLDSQRMQQVMDTLLRGTTERSARTVILDLTGISVMDAEVADALVQAARGVQLLGAEVVFTGIRRDVAQTLVEIQANLGGIVTRGTLRGGISYAMTANGRKEIASARAVPARPRG